MSWWAWYLLGGVLGLLQLVVGLVRSPLERIRFQEAPHKVQGAIAYAVLGAVIYGTLLWVVLGVIFHL